MVRQDLAGAPLGEPQDAEDAQVVAKTGRPMAHWAKVLDAYGADSKATADTVDHLQDRHGVPRAWARTVLTHYLKRHA